MRAKPQHRRICGDNIEHYSQPCVALWSQYLSDIVSTKREAPQAKSLNASLSDAFWACGSARMRTWLAARNDAPCEARSSKILTRHRRQDPGPLASPLSGREENPPSLYTIHHLFLSCAEIYVIYGRSLKAQQGPRHIYHISPCVPAAPDLLQIRGSLDHLRSSTCSSADLPPCLLGLESPPSAALATQEVSHGDADRLRTRPNGFPGLALP